MLAQDKKNSKWIVIELKKGASFDRTVVQTQTYIGWVKENLADKDEKVVGIIISGFPPDIRMKFAIFDNPDIEHKIYYYCLLT